MRHRHLPSPFLQCTVEPFLYPDRVALRAEAALEGTGAHTVSATESHTLIGLAVTRIEIGTWEDADILIDDGIVMLHLIAQGFTAEFDNGMMRPAVTGDFLSVGSHLLQLLPGHRGDTFPLVANLRADDAERGFQSQFLQTGEYLGIVFLQSIIECKADGSLSVAKIFGDSHRLRICSCRQQDGYCKK